MCASSAVPLLFVCLAGAALSASIKGGVNGTKGGGWTPPKDWDWSVTPGRLIPVSEATDDLPTPGYRMSQLQQRIPPNLELQPIPIMSVAATNTESNPEEKVIVIGQNQLPTDSKETSQDMSTSQQQETSEHEDPTPKERMPHTSLEEQELILLQDDPKPFLTRSRIPVVEEPMTKVELPEICSITGIGCRDPKPRPQHPDISQRPEPIPHPITSENAEVVTTTAKVEESYSEMAATVIETSNEEHTTQHYTSPSSTEQVDQLVTENVLSEGANSNHSVPSQSNNKNYGNDGVAQFQPKNITQELLTTIVPEFNISVPTVVHSVISSVSDYIGSNGSVPESENSTKISSTGGFTSESQEALQETDAQHQHQQHQQQQEQEVQQLKLDNVDQVPQEVREHIIDEQKLLQIANSWSSSPDSNTTNHQAQRRVDEEANEPKHEQHDEQKQEQAVVEEVKSEEMTNQEHHVKVEEEEHKDVVQATDRPTNVTEPSSIGDKIESYWKAATSYVSKALHL